MAPRADYGTNIDIFLNWLAEQNGRTTKPPAYDLYFVRSTKQIVARPRISTSTYDFGVVRPHSKEETKLVEEFADSHGIKIYRVNRFDWDTRQPPQEPGQ